MYANVTYSIYTLSCWISDKSKFSLIGAPLFLLLNLLVVFCYDFVWQHFINYYCPSALLDCTTKMFCGTHCFQSTVKLQISSNAETHLTHWDFFAVQLTLLSLHLTKRWLKTMSGALGAAEWSWYLEMGQRLQFSRKQWRSAAVWVRCGKVLWWG